MKIRINHHRKARIEMLPLIDIVFLLLVFFIYAMLSMAVHRGLPLDLPESREAKIEKKSTLSVSIKRTGQIFVNDSPVELDRLAATLSAKRAESADPGVLLFADRQLSYGALFRVLDRIHRAGLTRISLQAEADTEK